MTRRTAFSPTSARRRLTRAAAVVVLGAAGAVGLSACQWTSPITTQLHYDASDGKSADVGGIHILNALVVAAQKDGPGALQASFVNDGKTDKTMQVGIGNQVIGSVQVPAGKTVAVGAGGKQITIPKVGAIPGGMTDVVFGTESADAASVTLPVLAPQGPYASITPSAPATTGTATAGTGATAGVATATGTATPATPAPAATTPAAGAATTTP